MDTKTADLRKEGIFDDPWRQWRWAIDHLEDICTRENRCQTADEVAIINQLFEAAVIAESGSIAVKLEQNVSTLTV